MSHKILVLEDDATMREILLDTLEDEGHAVEGASSGSEALEAARITRFDLVVADVRMAGMDGLECLEALKQARPDLKTIVITGYAGDNAPLRALSIDVDDYLFKPFELFEFQRVVRRVLNAGLDRSGYQELVRGFMTGCRKLVRRAGEAMTSAHLAAIDTPRDKFFGNYFVAIRSGALMPGPALKIWDQLERLEVARQDLKGRATVEWQKIREGYRYLADLVVAHAEARTADAAGPREPGQVSREAFQELYARVKQGDVSAEQLKLAPLLRSVEPEALRRSPNLWSLRGAIWGRLAPARTGARAMAPA